jgi:competence protein ComFC
MRLLPGHLTGHFVDKQGIVVSAKPFLGIGRTMLDTVMPPCCVLCGESIRDPGFCPLCRAAITNSWPTNAVSCRFCGMPRPRESVPPHSEPCGQCKQQQQGFDEVIALGIYQDAIREAVVAAKLARHAPLAKAMGDLLAESIVVRLAGRVPDRVTFVPSHFLRRIKRQGVGGVVVMAAAVGKCLERAPDSLLRVTRLVRKQSMLADQDRPANVRGAFAVKKRYACGASPVLRDQHILLVDDVLTTGSTSSEIAKVLKTAGAARVTLAVVARAVRR